MAIDNTRLPENIERGAKGGAGFLTVIDTADAGFESRIVKWDVGRGEWDVGYGISNMSDMQAVNALFRSRKGRALPFRFKDFVDYQATDEPFGTADGATTTFQLLKSYYARDPDGNAVGDPDVRNITAPLTTTIALKNDGSTISSGDYTIDAATGVVTFTAAPSGTPGVLTWSGEFDVYVRFDIDRLPVTIADFGIGQISGITIVEVLGEN